MLLYTWQEAGKEGRLILSSGAKYNQINFLKNHVSGNARKIGVTVIWWFTLEAYQAECPVLLNNASCFPEIAGDAAIYFNLDKDGSDLANKVELLLSLSLEERQSLIDRQKDRLKRYSWENSAKQMAAIYQSIV